MANPKPGPWGGNSFAEIIKRRIKEEQQVSQVELERPNKNSFPALQNSTPTNAAVSPQKSLEASPQQNQSSSPDNVTAESSKPDKTAESGNSPQVSQTGSSEPSSAASISEKSKNAISPDNTRSNAGLVRTGVSFVAAASQARPSQESSTKSSSSPRKAPAQRWPNQKTAIVKPVVQEKTTANTAEKAAIIKENSPPITDEAIGSSAVVLSVPASVKANDVHVVDDSKQPKVISSDISCDVSVKKSDSQPASQQVEDCPGELLNQTVSSAKDSVVDFGSSCTSADATIPVKKLPSDVQTTIPSDNSSSPAKVPPKAWSGPLPPSLSAKWTNSPVVHNHADQAIVKSVSFDEDNEKQGKFRPENARGGRAENGYDERGHSDWHNRYDGGPRRFNRGGREDRNAGGRYGRGSVEEQYEEPGYDGQSAFAQYNGYAGNGSYVSANHNTQYHDMSSYYNAQQFYQPIAEVSTRSGPLFVNPLLNPVFPNGGEMYETRSAGNSLQRSRASPPQITNSLSPTITSTSLIKSFYCATEMMNLIMGRQGQGLRELRERYHCEMWIDEHEGTRNPGRSLLHFHGTEENVDAAVNKVIEKLNVLTSGTAYLEPLVGVQSLDVLRPHIPKLELPMGIILGAYVSHVERNGVLFLQLPSHPSFNRLDGCERRLNEQCGKAHTVPFIDPRLSPLDRGCLVAAPNPAGLPSNQESTGSPPPTSLWLRAVVTSSQVDDNGHIQLRSLDHGLSFSAPNTGLKLLPYECCHTPAQAIECRVVHGKFQENIPVVEQVTRNLHGHLLRQWVRVRLVNTLREAEALPLTLNADGTLIDSVVPVVEMWVMPNPSPRPPQTP